MVAITHTKVSTVPDDPAAVAAGQVVPSDWNAEHTIDGLGTAAEADVTDFATAAQGALADTAVQPADLAAVATSGAYADLSGKPTLGSAAAAATTDFATAAQGAKADTALQPAAIGVSVQAYDADLTAWAALTPSAKQDTLVSGTNIKTVNGTSLLGPGDVTIAAESAISKLLLMGF